MHKFLYVGPAIGRPFGSEVTFIRNGASRTSPPTVCMSITLFDVGADSISALLMFREHMECSPTVFGVKMLFVHSRIVTELTKPPFAREVPRNEAEGVPLRFRSNFLFWNGSS